VPALFVLFQSLQERMRPMKFEGDDENPDVTTELQQYANRPVEYEMQK
jgi:HAE1 family hydrophobic/amphiphilic exporter-1